jgi:hypothetical protein
VSFNSVQFSSVHFSLTTLLFAGSCDNDNDNDNDNSTAATAISNTTIIINTRSVISAADIWFDTGHHRLCSVASSDQARLDGHDNDNNCR